MTSRKPFGSAWQIIPGGAALLVLALLATAGGAIALNVSPRLFVGPTAAQVFAPAAYRIAPVKSEERQDAETDRLLSAIEREVSEWGASPKRR